MTVKYCKIQQLQNAQIICFCCFKCLVICYKIVIDIVYLSHTVRLSYDTVESVRLRFSCKDSVR